MLELFTDAKIETSADTRAKAVRALGLDEPPVSEKLSRTDFGSDEEYFHALTELSLRNNSPEYREAYQKIRREYIAQQMEAEAEATEQRHQAEIAQAIKDCVLSSSEQSAVDDEARRRAQDDLAFGRISSGQLGQAVAQYAEKLTRAAKEEKVHTADLNLQIRKAMREARHA